MAIECGAMSSGEASRYHALVRHLSRSLTPCLRGRSGHVLVAVSGGADSVALLRALHTLMQTRRWKLRLTVGHVQHHLRGDAEADAGFVAALAKALALPCERVDIEPAKAAANVEAAARRMRYDALHTIARQCGAAFVATAHHGDDQLETLLMAMLRGSGVAGMRGMSKRRRIAPDSEVRLIRPLLGVTREQLQRYLRDLGQPWREDHTNADTTRLRARLRAEVLPALSAMRRDVTQRANQLATHMQLAQRLIDRVIDDAMQYVTKDADGRHCMQRSDARGMDALTLGGVLRRVLGEAGIDSDRLGGRVIGPVVRAACDRAGGERVFDLPGGARMTVTREVVAVTVGGR